MIRYGFIDQIKDYASRNNVPIMNDSGIRFLTNYIKDMDTIVSIIYLFYAGVVITKIPILAASKDK